jgi:hypothetical protein
VGENLLHYWASLISFQATADTTQLDFAEGILSALREMTDTHGQFLRDFADSINFHEERDLVSIDGLRHRFRMATEILPPYTETQHQILLGDLCKIGLIGTFSAGFGHGIAHFHLTRHGVELLRLGGWSPKFVRKDTPTV